MSHQQELERIIRNRSDVFEKHFAAGNAEALVADYYVSDAQGLLVSAPDAPALRDRASTAALFAALFKDFSRARQVAHVVRGDGDLAYEVSNSYLTPRAGGADVEFRYVAVWRKCADTWRVETDFFATGPIV
jgi:ketosteroid isomerase-like protein